MSLPGLCASDEAAYKKGMRIKFNGHIRIVYGIWMANKWEATYFLYKYNF